MKNEKLRAVWKYLYVMYSNYYALQRSFEQVNNIIMILRTYITVFIYVLWLWAAILKLFDAIKFNSIYFQFSFVTLNACFTA